MSKLTTENTFTIKLRESTRELIVDAQQDYYDENGIVISMTDIVSLLIKQQWKKKELKPLRIGRTEYDCIMLTQTLDTGKKIAAHLNKADSTVLTSLRNLKEKLNTESNSESLEVVLKHERKKLLEVV